MRLKRKVELQVDGGCDIKLCPRCYDWIRRELVNVRVAAFASLSLFLLNPICDERKLCQPFRSCVRACFHALGRLNEARCTINNRYSINTFRDKGGEQTNSQQG